MGNKTKDNNIVQIKITLLDTDPEIFRRVLVYANTPLADLHDVIQNAMGWEHDHLYHFIKDKVIYVQDDDTDFGLLMRDRVKSESEYTVDDLVPNVRAKFLYEYDFGDSWMHEVKREKFTQAVTELQHPICLEGQGACPPEDCGGVYGYYQLLEVLADPKNPEYEESLEWFSDDFKPKYFDIDEANRKLKIIRYK
jgi:hypothetical protein